MKIMLLTIGSRGDVQPYVALGKGLKAAGHTVTIATCERFRSFVERHGLHYGFIDDEILRVVDSDQGKALMEDTQGIVRIIAANIKLARQIGPIQQRMLRQSWDVANELQPDLICFHPKGLLGPVIAEKLDIPGILTSPIPMLVPTGQYPCLGFPRLPLGAWYNRSTYRVVHLLIQLFAGRYVRAWRRETGTPVQRRNLDVLYDKAGRPIPALHGYSRFVAPEPDDWPETAIASGYWFLDEQNDWQPPAKLRSFLAAGPPPIYIGFGSISGRDPRRLTDAVVEALRLGGHRGILATGWGGLDAADMPDHVLAIDEAPHDWLFPRVSAVVHHGGAGTTAAGLRAGRPTLVCPFFADQPYWGAAVHALGAGPEPIPQKKVNAHNLRNAFDSLANDGTMRAAAEAVGKQLAQEDGVGRAVCFVEKVAETHRRRSGVSEAALPA